MKQAARQRALQSLPNPEFDYLPLGGGLDLETPIWEVAPGKLRQAKNYEIGINDGYIDIEGYERFDGQAAPSDAQYGILDVTITGSFSDGDTVTQLVSGATGVIVVGGVVTSGAQDYLVLTKVTGTFDATNDLQVSAVTEGNADSLLKIDGALTSALHAQYKNLAADEYRNDIAAITGAGNVLGVFKYNGVVYAWRNNVGETAADLWKESASGWTQVALGREASFTSGGTHEVLEGDTLLGQSSGFSCVVTRVVLESGTWDGGDAAGRIIYASQTGAFTPAELMDEGANLDVLTISDAGAAITMLPDGMFEVDYHNFGGEAGEERVYGCDAINRGWEFDGTVFAPIDTGMTTDTPEHVVIHRNHLFFSFAGSAQHSGLSTPYIWAPIFGAAELATGQQITGFQVEPGAEGNASLAIFNRNRVNILYGTSSADWNLVTYRDEVGAFPRTIQQLGYTLYLDDRGITNLRTVQDFGNFQHATLSRDIQALINQKRSIADQSCIVREKNQYRLFFTDTTAIYMTMDGNKVRGMMPIELDHRVTCIDSRENASGDEEIYFGSTNGMVYQMDKGTSFDGADIATLMVTHFHFGKSLGWIKKYFDGVIEARGEGYAQFDFTFELAYTSSDIPQPGVETNTLSFTTARWDAFTWDAFFWDGEELGPSGVKLEGDAENISIIIRKTSDYFEPVLFSGIRIRQALRRQVRG
jgi:hypothetical protein